MTRFKQYYRDKGPGKPGKSTVVSAETSYGSPEHAKWLYEKNLIAISKLKKTLADQVREIKSMEEAQKIIDQVLAKKRYG